MNARLALSVEFTARTPRRQEQCAALRLPTLASWRLGGAHFRMLAVLWAFCWMAGSAFAQLEGSTPLSTAGTSEEALQAFLAQLQPAVAAGQREVVAGLVAYPLSAWVGGKSATIKSRKEFVAKYDAIFTPALKKTVAAAQVANCWANWKGVMFEQGRIWLGATGPQERLRIITINAPTP